MALNVSLLELPWPVYVLAFVLVAAAIAALTIIEIRLGRKVKARKEYEETYYQSRLSTVMALKSDPDAFLIALDKVVREFFSESLGLQKMARYSELVSKLEQAQRMKSAAFCREMEEALYSGEKIGSEDLLKLYSGLKTFVLQKEKHVVASRAPQRPPQVSEESVNANILKYVVEGRKRGFNFDSLNEKLVTAGFDKGEIARVISRVKQKEALRNEKPRIPANTEKAILTNFFNPKSKDLDLIKQGIEDKDELGRAEIIEIVPYKKEEIAKKKTVKYPEKEPRSYGQIGSLDDLDRVKEKIKERRQGVLSN